MDSKLLQSLRQKLSKRANRIGTTQWNMYHSQLVQFWTFLHSHDLFKGILDQLEQRHPHVLQKVQCLLNETLPYNEFITFDMEEEQAAAGYFVIRDCVEQPTHRSGFSKVAKIGDKYGAGEGGYEEMIVAFNQVFLIPLYEYLDEQLDNQNILLYLLMRYKHRCEWFYREELLNLYKNESVKGEKLLAMDLYRYLHDQGIEFHIEPSSATGEIDLISEQVGDERLLVDAKLFKGDTRYIRKGFHQIYTYTLTYNQPMGFLVIFNVSDHQLCFTSTYSDGKYAGYDVDGKSLFMLTIDIATRPSASKRGELKAYTLGVDDLLKVVEDDE